MLHTWCPERVLDSLCNATKGLSVQAFIHGSPRQLARAGLVLAAWQAFRTCMRRCDRRHKWIVLRSASVSHANLWSPLVVITCHSQCETTCASREAAKEGLCGSRGGHLQLECVLLRLGIHQGFQVRNVAKQDLFPLYMRRMRTVVVQWSHDKATKTVWKVSVVCVVVSVLHASGVPTVDRSFCLLYSDMRPDWKVMVANLFFQLLPNRPLVW